MEIISACWDEPKETDFIRDDVYFGTTTAVNEIVDHRRVGTVYNQFINSDTHMACGSYGIIHADNINELLAGGQEINPRSHWLSFVKAHKTNKYDPIVKGSSLQAQVDFARAVEVIGGYYKVTTKDEIREGLSKGYMGYSGSTNIDREATKSYPDNVCVIKSGSPAHIICFIGYDKDYVYIRNSGALKHMKLKREDIDKMFSIYMIVPRVDAHIFARSKAKMEQRKGLYETYIVKQLEKKQMRRVAKDAERKVIDGKNCVNINGDWYEIIKKVS